MPREITLFTDDGLWAAVVTAWRASWVIYHDIGVRARVYRLGVPPTWGSELGPWAKLPGLSGPWKAKGPWGAWGPFRVDGPWAHKGEGGPWGFFLPRSWIETRADEIVIDARFRGRALKPEVARTARSRDASFLRLSESGFGLRLVLLAPDRTSVVVENLWAEIKVTFPGGVTRTGRVTTGGEEPERD